MILTLTRQHILVNATLRVAGFHKHMPIASQRLKLVVHGCIPASTDAATCNKLPDSRPTVRTHLQPDQHDSRQR